MFKLTAIAALTLCIAAPASAGVIAAYDTKNTTTVAADITGAGITAADLTRGAGITIKPNGNNFRSKDWTIGGDLNTAIANEDYLEWGFSSTSTVDLASLSFRYDRGRRGAKALAVLASFDGGAFTQIYSDAFADTASEIANVNLNAYSANDVTFRLYAWDATNAAGGFFLRNNGVGPGNDYGIVVTSVPLPAGLPLMAGAFALLGLARRKG